MSVNYKGSLFSILFLCFALLAGCSDGGDGVADARDSENSFPPQPDSPFETPTEDEGQPTPEANEIVVEVQATDAMLASWDRTLYRWLTPTPAFAFRGQSPVTVKDLSVVQVSRDLTNSIAPNVTLDYTTRENDDGTYSLLFNSATTIPVQIDVYVRAELENGTVLWAPLINDGSTIRVNIVSTYVTEQFMQVLQENNRSLTELRPCGQDTGCTNQHEARLQLWLSLQSAAQNFDTTLPSTMSAQELKAFLSQQEDFRLLVTRGVQSIIDEDYVGAISAPLDFNNLLDTKTTVYNSVFFTFGLSEREPDQENGGSVLFNRVSTVATTPLDDGSTEYIYPTLTETSLKTTITTHSLFGDLPYQRRSLSQTETSSFLLNENQTSEINAFSSGATYAYLTTKGFLEFPRTPDQTITGKNTANIRGWLTNPLSVSLYANEARSFLASAPFSTGNVYDLEALDSGTFGRTRRVEHTNEFNYEMSLEAQADTSVPDITSGKRYGVLSILQTLSATPSPGVTFEARVSEWSVSAQVVRENSGDALDNSVSFRLNRISGASFDGLSSATAGSGTYELQGLVSVVTDSATKEQVEQEIGRIALLRGGTTYATGAIAPDGDRMALTIESGATRGLIDAVVPATEFIQLPGGTYRLQGHTFGMTDTETRLVNYAGSLLEVDDNGTGTLTLSRRLAKQNVTTNKVTNLSPMASPDQPLQAGLPLENGKLTADFGTLEGEPLTLQGYLSSDGTSLHLILRHGSQIGLIWGFRELAFPKS